MESPIINPISEPPIIIPVIDSPSQIVPEREIKKLLIRIVKAVQLHGKYRSIRKKELI